MLLLTNTVINCNSASSWFSWNCFAVHCNGRSELSVASLYRVHLEEQSTRDSNSLILNNVRYTCFVCSVQHTKSRLEQVWFLIGILPGYPWDA